MIRSKSIMIAFGLISAIALTGCALTTAGNPGTAGTAPAITQTLTGSATLGQGTTAPGSTGAAPDTSAPGTTSGSTTPATRPVSSPATTPAGTAVVTTTAPGPALTNATQPARTSPATTPGQIRSGNAFDTATVRDWMRNGPSADYYPEKKLVFLTFDDGPSTRVTPQILDVLKANQVQGTFFYYTYGNLGSRADVVRRTYSEGHTIAVHTAFHKYNILYPKRKANVAAIVSDAQRAISDIQAILGNDWKPSVYRFPGGAFSWNSTESRRTAMTEAKTALRGLGMEYIDWNAMTGDSDNSNKDKSPSGLVKYAIKTTKNVYGDVVVLLMHDASHIPNTAKALQGVIDYYKNAGYEFGILK